MATESGKNNSTVAVDGAALNRPPPGFPPRPPTTNHTKLSRYGGFSGFEFRGSSSTKNHEINITPSSPPSQKEKAQAEAQAKDQDQQEAELNDFIKSLDNIFPQPARLDQDFIFSDEATRASATELAHARRRLSSHHLPLNFHTLIYPDKVAELVDLSTKLLKSDPTLNPHQVSMLKLVQKLPSKCKTAIEVKKLDEEIKEFLISLQSKMEKASLLETQCKDIKEMMSKLRVEVEANVKEVQELDKQMSPDLGVHRGKLVSVGRMKMKELKEIRSYHNKLADKFARVSGEIKATDSTKRVLQVKKTLLKDHCFQIWAEFSPLKRFTI